MMVRILEQARRAASRSPAELWTRALQQLHVTGERASLLVRGESSAPTAGIGNRRDAGSAARLPSAFFAGATDVAATVAALRQHASQCERELLDCAARIDAGAVP